MSQGHRTNGVSSFSSPVSKAVSAINCHPFTHPTEEQLQILMLLFLVATDDEQQLQYMGKLQHTKCSSLPRLEMAGLFSHGLSVLSMGQPGWRWEDKISSPGSQHQHCPVLGFRYIPLMQ